jgi:hypothetical protein
MGFSALHSSEVPLVLNLQTGSITPQYHIVFDDHFSTVSSVEREINPPDHWADLCLEDAMSVPTDSSPLSSTRSNFLDNDWLTLEERELKGHASARQQAVQDTFLPLPSLPTIAPPVSSTLSSVSSPLTAIQRESTSLGQREPTLPTTTPSPVTIVV